MKRHKILKPDFKEKTKKIIDSLKNYLDEIYELAIRDEKTGVYNFRFFESVLGLEIEKARRGKQELSLIIVDIDFFKKINDEFGHLIGDKLLIELAKTLKRNLRKYDVLARYGGEEFLILLPGASLRKAKRIASRIRKKIKNNGLLEKYGLTISLGISCYREKDSKSSLIKRADRALYLSKKEGRDRISIL